MVAVGLVEGLGQVNWRKVALIAAWWFLGPFPIIVAALFIFWQGTNHVRTTSPAHPNSHAWGLLSNEDAQAQLLLTLKGFFTR